MKMKVFNPKFRFLFKISLMCLLVASIVFACKESQDDKEILKKTSEELGLSGTSYLKLGLC